MGLFDWLRPSQPAAISETLWLSTMSSLPFLAALAVDEKKRLKTLAEAFLSDKEFSTAGGLILTDAICVSIAAQGCLPVLNLGLSAYRDWVGIVVYPNEFIVPRQLEDEDGVVHEFSDVISGEAWEGGPLLVSWHDIQMAGEGYNVVIHEFAHKLDMLNGAVDGIPALHGDLTVDEWEGTFFPAWENFCTRINAGEITSIDPYASESPEEFFAVISECFFEIPSQLAHDYPALYQLFCRYYLQDPLRRIN
ncbi:MAG: zinc-dependent peptidase [Azonexus sp.]|nr:zinc-dependent peptidase [Azonexus sp.]